MIKRVFYADSANMVCYSYAKDLHDFQATQKQQLKSEATPLWRKNKLCFVMNKFCMFENVV